MPDDVEGAFAWDRRGAPQVRHTHGFPALIRVLLRDRYPDVLQALVDAGVGELSILPPTVPPDVADYERDAADLQVLCCRRTTLEWVLRRSALAEPAVTFRVGVGVAGLLADAGPQAARGAGRPARRRHRAGGRRRRRQHRAALRRARLVRRARRRHRRGGAPDRHRLPLALLPERRRDRTCRWATSAGAGPGSASSSPAPTTAPTRPRSPCPVDDGELRAHLLDPDRFEAVLPLFREMEPVVALGGTPITPVQVMGGLINRIRRYVDGRRRAAGPRLLRHRRLAHLHQPALRPRVVARRAPGGARGRRARRAPRRPRRRGPRLRGGERGQGRALVPRVGHDRRRRPARARTVLGRSAGPGALQSRRERTPARPGRPPADRGHRRSGARRSSSCG